jgi:hypothetical protein
MASAVNFRFARRKAPSENIRDIQLCFEDFTDTEIKNHFQLVAVDPGRTQAFTAAYGAGNKEHEIRRMSTKEYYANTGSKRRNQALQQEKRQKGITEIEQNIPIPKPAKLDQFEHYIAYI